MKKSSIIVVLFFMTFIAHSVLEAENNVSYTTEIKQLINAKGCIGCHNFTDSYINLLDKKINGIPLVNTAKPDSSVLIWRIEGKTPSGSSLSRMPQGGPYFSEEDITLFKTWIAQGALENSTVGVEETAAWSEIKLKFK
ncbi:hypothetical protein ACFL5B_03835 [Candidatus Latescibacterota bacterium]